MPSFTIEAVADASANAEGAFNGTGTVIDVGQLTTSSTDHRIAATFEFTSIPRHDIVGSAVLAFTVTQTGVGAITVDVYMYSAINPATPTDAATLRGAALTTAKGSRSFPDAAAAAEYTIDLTAVLQEQVNKGAISKVVVLLRDRNSSFVTNNRLRVRAIESTNAGKLRLSVTHSAPPAVTGEATASFASPPPIAEGSVGQGQVSGEAVATFGTSVVAEGFVGEPPTVTGQTVATFEPLPPQAFGELPDPKVNHPYAVVAPLFNSHHFVTESGEVLGFAARFDKTLGGIRDGVIGQSNTGWLPLTGLTSRTPAPLQFVAALLDREDARFDGDLLEDALPFARELHLPDGDVFDLWGAQKRARPNDFSVDVSVATKGAHPRHPLLSGTINAAFPTVGSSKRLPVYAIDPAGGITAPLLAKRVPYGMMCFGVRLTERGVIPLGSVGRPVEADGSFDPTSVAVSYQDQLLKLSLFGIESRVRETWLGPYGAVLVVFLFWREGFAHLVTVSDTGLFHWDLPVGDAVDMSERVLTAGVRADGVGSGAFMALGSGSLRANFFSMMAPTQNEAEEAALKLYRKLTAPGLSWEVATPELSLSLTRTDSKALELAPGESVTLGFAAEVLGNASPLPLTAEVAAPTGITATVASAGQDGNRQLYTVTLSAPGNLPEGSYAWRLEAKASGADNEGSLLVGVRASFDGIAEVSATPAISSSATAVLPMSDPVMMRHTEVLRDTSANGNTFSYAGYARPDRHFRGILATGKFGAAVFSGPLVNSSQAQRMSGDQTFSLIVAEVSKTPVGGVLYQVAAADSENGVHILRAQGGFTLRTVNGAATVTSPDVLAWSSGYARLVLIITATEVILLDRDSGRSIRLARPAWPDAGVRTTRGALRTTAGALSQLTYTHILTETIHPYALSEIQRRRNMDALTAFASADDGKGEFPPNAVGILLFDDNTAERPAAKYQNFAAPALAITASPVGTVDSIAGGVYPRGGGSIVEIPTGIPSSEVLTVITDIQDFKGSHTVPYEAQLAVSDTVVGSGSTMLARHENGQPFAMIRNTDLSHTYGTVTYTPVSGSNLFLFRFVPASDTLEVTALANGAKRSVKTSNSYTGTLVVTLGGVRKADGFIDRRTPTKNRALIICRGETSADDVSVTQKLLTG